MKYATAEEVTQVTRQAFLALGFHEELANRIGGLLGRTLSGSVSEDEAVSMLKDLFQQWTKYYESEFSHVDKVALKTIGKGSIKDPDREVEVVVKTDPDMHLYRMLCDYDPDVKKFRTAHEAVFVIAEMQNARMTKWLEKHKTDRSSLLPFEKTPLAMIGDQELQRLQRLIENEADLVELFLRSDQKEESGEGSGGKRNSAQASDSFRGYLGGEDLRDALGIHSTQAENFERQLGRKRNEGSFGDKDWKEDSDRRKGDPLYLFADTGALRGLAERYKSPKAEQACRSSV